MGRYKVSLGDIMIITFENKGLYYKYKDILTILNKYGVDVVDSKRTDDELEFEFKDVKEYERAVYEACVIPLDHEIIEK